MSLEVQEARASDYGVWVAVKDERGNAVYVWGCGCCDLHVTNERPEISGEWKPYEP